MRTKTKKPRPLQGGGARIHVADMHHGEILPSKVSWNKVLAGLLALPGTSSLPIPRK